ncbi:MAG: serine hydrolase, partial [Myxococcales bacterium]|nr:serine hydrolase [Myxococcales bacterium]
MFRHSKLPIICLTGLTVLFAGGCDEPVGESPNNQPDISSQSDGRNFQSDATQDAVTLDIEDDMGSDLGADLLADVSTIDAHRFDATRSDAGPHTDTGTGTPDGHADDSWQQPDQEPEPAPQPSFAFFDDLIDSIRGSVPSWATFIYITEGDNGPEFSQVDYADTGDRVDFWPASTIKIYTVTAALELLAVMDMSVDAEATFYHYSGGAWVEDITVSFRQMIFDVFDHSSNSDYTLLLRFCGVDWINTEFLVESNGFQETALMTPYVSDRPYRYSLGEQQRIVVHEGEREETREHSWSGTSYSDPVGCTIYNEDHIANCSSTRDMAEHMRRIIFHEALDPSDRFDIPQDVMDWYRWGGPEDVLRTREHSYATRVYRVFPNAEYYHKAGRVTYYASDLHYVRDPDSGIQYIAAFNTHNESMAVTLDIAEAMARVAANP